MTFLPAEAPPDPAFFVAGGSLHKDAACYVTRHADAALFDALQRGKFCYTLTSRQMGKSSLMVRTAVRLREAGVAVAVLDLTAFGTNLTPEQWYDLLLSRVGRHLGLEDEMDDFWSENQRTAPLARFLAGLRDVALPSIQKRAKREEREGKRKEKKDENASAKAQSPALVLMIDEVDLVRSLPFSADEFFAAIRELYNRRTQDEAMNQIAVALFGVAAPSDLIRNPKITPFNIGTRIELKDFTPEEAAPLAAGMGSAELLARVLYWTGGHPYLTLRLCQAAAEERAVAPADIDRLCGELYLSSRARENDTNLLFVRDRLLRSDEDIAALLALYRNIWRGKTALDDETSPLVSVLRLSGIARAESGVLHVRNRIYAQVFDLAWIAANRPEAEVRRQKAAYRRGVLRAVAVSSVLLGVMALLTFVAFRESRHARLATLRANTATNAANRANQDAQSKAGDLTITNTLLRKLQADIQQEHKLNKALQSFLPRDLKRDANGMPLAKSALLSASNPVTLKKQQDTLQALVDSRQRIADDSYQIYLRSKQALDRAHSANDEQQATSDERQYMNSLVELGKARILRHQLEKACTPLLEAQGYFSQIKEESAKTNAIGLLLAEAHYRLKKTDDARNDYLALMKQAKPNNRQEFRTAAKQFGVPEEFYAPLAIRLGVSLNATPEASAPPVPVRSIAPRAWRGSPGWAVILATDYKGASSPLYGVMQRDAVNWYRLLITRFHFAPDHILLLAEGANGSEFSEFILNKKLLDRTGLQTPFSEAPVWTGRGAATNDLDAQLTALTGKSADADFRGKAAMFRSLFMEGAEQRDIPVFAEPTASSFRVARDVVSRLARPEDLVCFIVATHAGNDPNRIVTQQENPGVIDPDNCLTAADFALPDCKAGRRMLAMDNSLRYFDENLPPAQNDRFGRVVKTAFEGKNTLLLLASDGSGLSLPTAGRGGSNGKPTLLGSAFFNAVTSVIESQEQYDIQSGQDAIRSAFDFGMAHVKKYLVSKPVGPLQPAPLISATMTKNMKFDAFFDPLVYDTPPTETRVRMKEANP